jgi:DNA helicase IV
VLRPATVVLERYAPELVMPRALRSSLIPTELLALGEEPLGQSILSVLRDRPGEGVRTAACICHDSIGERLEATVAAIAEAAAESGFELMAVRSSESRGLEFDVSLIIEPERFGNDPRGLAHLFVALTRSTQWSAVLSSEPTRAWLREIFA